MIAFDASTLILLAKVSILEVTVEQYRILITSVVKDESAKQDSMDARLIAKFIHEERISLKDVQPGQKDIRKLETDFKIGPGEASSLWLAHTLNAPIATDDGLAIKAAKVLGIRFMTAIHFLISAFERGAITEELALAKLEKLEKYGRYHRAIIENARIRLEERK